MITGNLSHFLTQSFAFLLSAYQNSFSTLLHLDPACHIAINIQVSHWFKGLASSIFFSLLLYYLLLLLVILYLYGSWIF